VNLPFFNTGPITASRPSHAHSRRRWITRGDFCGHSIENAIAGRRALRRSSPQAIAWLTRNSVPIHLCLLAPFGASLAELRAVRSHPVALAQCRLFFAKHNWLISEPHPDTAGAARDVALLGDRTVGAVAGAAAAERYGLDIVARSIEDVPANWTRFVIVSER
jgi:prephenate dehydratase